MRTPLRWDAQVITFPLKVINTTIEWFDEPPVIRESKLSRIVCSTV